MLGVSPVSYKNADTITHTICTKLLHFLSLCYIILVFVLDLVLYRQFALKYLHSTVESNYESKHLIRVKFGVSFCIVLV
jgi:hypothetical protein